MAMATNTVARPITAKMSLSLFMGISSRRLRHAGRSEPLTGRPRQHGQRPLSTSKTRGAPLLLHPSRPFHESATVFAKSADSAEWPARYCSSGAVK